MMKTLGSVVMVLVAGLGLMAASCQSPTAKVMRGGELGDALQRAGWTPVDFPREVLGAGSIVSITETSGIRYRGKLENCLPPGLVKPERKNAALPGGARRIELTSDAFLGFHKIARIGGEYGKVGRVEWEVGKAEEVVLDEIVLTRALRRLEDEGKLDAVCREYLQAPSVYVITSALAVSDYSYTLWNKSGGQIGLTLEKLKGYVDVGADVKVEVTAEGAIKFSEPLYIAFNRASYASLRTVPGGLPESTQSAQEIMEKYYRVRAIRW